MNVAKDFRTGLTITQVQSRNSIQEALVPNPIYIKLVDFFRAYQVYQLKLQIRFNHNLRKYLNLHKCWINLTITGTHPTLTGPRFTSLLWRRILRHFKLVGYVSIDIVVQALNHVLYQEMNFVSSVITDYSISMNLY